MSQSASASAQFDRAVLELYATWLKEESARRVPFAELCEKHPEAADQLRELHKLAAAAQSAFSHKSLRERFGPDADLELTLEDEPLDGSPAADIEVLPPGRYTIRGEVARGGMGVIYRVRDRELNRTLAMKVMLGGADPAGEEKGATMLARFVEEVQLTAQLDHPGIVTVHELGADAGGRPYFTMKLVKGRDLAHVFKLAAAEQEGWSLPRAVGALIKACQAVAYAHSKGVIHRDLKPANVMAGRFGEVYVMDWGLAKIKGRKDARDLRLRPEAASLTEIRTPRSHQNDSSENSPLITMDGSVVGTPAFMPPEQAKGQVEQVDALSDIYSLGAMLYTLLAGRVPYTEPDTRLSPHTLLAMVVQGPPRRIHLLNPAAPPELVAICEKAMAREKSGRYQSCLELAEDLQAWLDRRVVKAYRTGAVAELKSWVIRNPATALASAAALLLLLASLAFVSRQNRELVRQRAEITRQRNSAHENLYASLTREAAATRSARGAGYRDRVFDLVAQANALDVKVRSLFDLRSQAVACLGDFAGLTPVILDGIPTNRVVTLEIFDNSGSLLALGLSGGGIQLREMPSGKIAAEFESGSRVVSLAFNSPGDELFSLSRRADLPPEQILKRSELRTWKRAATGRWAAATSREQPGLIGLRLAADRVWLVRWNEEDRTVSLADALTGRELHRLSFPGARPEHPLFASSPDARYFALCQVREGLGEPTHLFNLESGKRIELKNPPVWFAQMIFTQDSRHLACAYHTGVTIYRTADFQQVAELPEHIGDAAAIDFSVSGSVIAIPVYQQRRTRILDWTQRKELGTLDLAANRVRFSPDGQFLCTAWRDRVSILPVDTRREKVQFPAHPGGTPGVSFGPDGTRLASIGKDRVLRMSDSATGNTLWEAGPVPGLGQSVAFHPSAPLLASSSFETLAVSLWDARNGRKLQQLEPDQWGLGWSVSFSPDGGFLAACGEARGLPHVRMWRVETSSRPDRELHVRTELLAAPWRTNLADTRLLHASFSGDSKLLTFFEPFNAAGSFLHSWEFQTSQPPQRWPLGNWWHWQPGGLTPAGVVMVHKADGPIVAIDPRSGKETVLSGNKQYPSVGLAPSPDGRSAACIAAGNGAVSIWDAVSGRMRYSLPEEDGTVWWMAWSPDSQRLAITRSSGAVSVWNLAEVNRVLTQLKLDDSPAAE